MEFEGVEGLGAYGSGHPAIDIDVAFGVFGMDEQNAIFGIEGPIVRNTSVLIDLKLDFEIAVPIGRRNDFGDPIGSDFNCATRAGLGLFGMFVSAPTDHIRTNAVAIDDDVDFCADPPTTWFSVMPKTPIERIDETSELALRSTVFEGGQRFVIDLPEEQFGADFIRKREPVLESGRMVELGQVPVLAQVIRNCGSYPVLGDEFEHELGVARVGPVVTGSLSENLELEILDFHGCARRLQRYETR